MNPNRVRFVVVTGLSGSGKTVALKALEDLGYFCIDNLPAALLPKFVQLSVLSGEMISRVGIGMDTREGGFLSDYREAFKEIAALGISVEVLYLEAQSEVILRRFSETRRLHPLAKDSTLEEGIAREIELLKGIRELADMKIDTSSMNVHELKKVVWAHFERAAEDQKMQLTLESFGFRNGIPSPADMVIDARFLPNPYFVEGLRELTGEDEAVADYVLKNPRGEEFIEKLSALLTFLIPQYEAEGKRHFTVAIGCTGGRHRSVATVKKLEQLFAGSGRPVRTIHRDIAKGEAGGK